MDGDFDMLVVKVKSAGQWSIHFFKTKRRYNRSHSQSNPRVYFEYDILWTAVAVTIAVTYKHRSTTLCVPKIAINFFVIENGYFIVAFFGHNMNRQKKDVTAFCNFGWRNGSRRKFVPQISKFLSNYTYNSLLSTLEY